MRWKFGMSVILATALFGSCQKGSAPGKVPVKVGLDRVSEAEFRGFFEGKTLGIVTNHTAMDHQGRFITAVFQEMPEVSVGALFGPEHGIRGQAEAGAKVDSGQDPLHGVPIYSLYGKTRKPSPEMLQGIDALVFDIQDVGARFYTYIYTMAYAMEAAAENDLPIIVLDRPNPITGKVEGNILDTAYASFVGRFPIPQRHGMTVAELAALFNEAGWIGKDLKADLKVVPMAGWRRDLWFDQTDLTFVNPSPNIPGPGTATVYPATCLIEGTNLSEGRGTPLPFRVFGAPWLNTTALVEKLNSLSLEGVSFGDTLFIPVRIPGAAENPKYREKTCRGITVKVTNRDAFSVFRSGVSIVNAIQELHPDSLKWREGAFDRLTGTNRIRLAIQKGESMAPVFAWAAGQAADFERKTRPYLLYE